MKTRTWRRSLLAVAALAAVGLASLTASTSAGAAKPLIRATLLDTAGAEIGEVVFKGKGTSVSRVEVEVVAAAAPGLGDFHGFHVHTTGDCDPLNSGSANVPFGSAGGHWNPGGASHGVHAGDMPSVLIHANGNAYMEFDTDRIDVSALLDTDGSAVILHAGRDNFANIPTTYSSGGVPGPNATTLATGDSGGRYACGVVTPA
ncbi:MAG: superoxide dismutase family protein [Acidimicrobiales bacterium]